MTVTCYNRFTIRKSFLNLHFTNLLAVAFLAPQNADAVVLSQDSDNIGVDRYKYA